MFAWFIFVLSSSLFSINERKSMVCAPVRGDNPGALSDYSFIYFIFVLFIHFFSSIFIIFV